MQASTFRHDERMPHAPDELLTGLLKRHLALVLSHACACCPAAVRPQIGLAYLLARTTDTIADTATGPAGATAAGVAGDCANGFSAATALLSTSASWPAGRARPPSARCWKTQRPAWPASRGLTPADLQLVREVLDTITSGQELDLRRFASADLPGSVVALRTDAELDDYTYRVAGCVGEFWTKMCRAHCLPEAALDDGTSDRQRRALRQGTSIGEHPARFAGGVAPRPLLPARPKRWPASGLAPGRSAGSPPANPGCARFTTVTSTGPRRIWPRAGLTRTRSRAVRARPTGVRLADPDRRKDDRTVARAERPRPAAARQNQPRPGAGSDRAVGALLLAARRLAANGCARPPRSGRPGKLLRQGRNLT